MTFILAMSMDPKKQLYAQTSSPKALENLIITTSKGEQKFFVEIAEDEATKEIGLMFRKSMAEDHGMLFVYPDPIVITMWMRNTYIPLDMIFIQPDGTISHIARNAEPFSEEIISSKTPAKAVLELNAGSADKAGIKIGDKVIYKTFQPK